MADVNLNFLARQIERLITDVGSLRDELRMHGAMLARTDATLIALVNEMRTSHQQTARLDDRIRRLEDASFMPPPS